MAVHLLATNALAVRTFRVLSAPWSGPKLSDDYGSHNPLYLRACTNAASLHQSI